MEEGSCEKYTLRWYFNSHVQACRPFIYSGCKGNDNRFLHQEECEAVCLGWAEGTKTHVHAHTRTHLMFECFNNSRSFCRFSAIKDFQMIVTKSFAVITLLSQTFCQMFFGLFIYWFVVTPTQLQCMVTVGYYPAPLLYVFLTCQNRGKWTKIEFRKHTHASTQYNILLNSLLHSLYKTSESAYPIGSE